MIEDTREWPAFLKPRKAFPATEFDWTPRHIMYSLVFLDRRERSNLIAK